MRAAVSEKDARKGELLLREPKAKRGKIDSKSIDSSVIEEKSRKVKSLSEKTPSKSLSDFDSSLDALFTRSTRAAVAEDQPDEEKLRAEMKNKLQELVIEAREEEKNKKFKGSSCRTEVTVINDKIILENEKCLRKKAQGKKIEKSDKDEVASDDASDVDSAVKGGRTSVEKVGESPEVLAKTLFVGNVPTSCLEKEHGKMFRQEFSKFGTIESVRFRSIAFENKLMDKKMALQTKKFEQGRTSMNAYVVYKEAASIGKALGGMQGFLFVGHHLRVDSCADSSQHNKKKTIFVGNLPFDIEEEELWQLFQEKCAGSPPLKSIRVLRNPKTNKGKGIAFVEFQDKVDVAKGLSLNETEFRDRKLRVTTFKGTVQKKIHELAKSNPKDNRKLKIDTDKAMNPASRRKNSKFEKKNNLFFR